jgi:hypothetical protein
MNPDSYNFLAFCKECNEERSVSCSRTEVLSDKPVEVYAIACDHSWTLSADEKEKLQSQLAPLETHRLRPHGLAIREGFTGTVEDASANPHHVATYDCKCGEVGYRIFVNETHYSDGQRFQKFVARALENIHARNAKHPDVIQIPTEAEFTT